MITFFKGTADFTAGQNTIVAHGTPFTGVINGAVVQAPDAKFYELVFTGDFTATLDRNYEGVTALNAAYTIWQIGPLTGSAALANQQLAQVAATLRRVFNGTAADQYFTLNRATAADKAGLWFQTNEVDKFRLGTFGGTDCVAQILVAGVWTTVFSVSEAGVVTVATAAPGTNTTQAANAAFVNAAVVNSLGHSNILLNSAFEIAQRFGSNPQTFTANPAGYGFYPVVDRFTYENRGSHTVTVQRVTDAPPGFPYSLKLTVVTPQASFGPDDSCTIFQPVEGSRLAKLAYGTANAAPVVIAFPVKAHRPGKYGGTWKKTNNGGTVLSYGFSFTINNPDNWELKTISVPGVTTGNWITGPGLTSGFLHFALNAGSNLQVTEGAWTEANGSSVLGVVSGAGSTSDVFQVGPPIIIPGTVAPTSFTQLRLMLRNQAEEQLLCWRYFRRWAQPPVRGFMYSATLAARLACPLPVPMANIPDLSMGGNLQVTDFQGNLSTIASLGTNISSTETLDFNANLASPLTIGSGCNLNQSYPPPILTDYIDLNAGVN
jgi:hypothetical protein